MKFVQIPIKELFENHNGSAKYTKKYIDENTGVYPVFSAKQTENGVLGFVNTYDYDTTGIQITTNGYAGKVFLRKNEKFNLNGDTRLYILKEKYKDLDYEYLSYVMQIEFDKCNFSWENKASISKTQDILLKIPVKENGEYNLEKQKEFAEQHESLKFIREQLKRRIFELNNLKVEIISTFSKLNNFSCFKISDLFDSKKGNSKYTKAYCKDNHGDFIVYAGNTQGVFGRLSTADFNGPNLTYSTDGEYAGTLEILTGSYNIGGHRALLLPKSERINIEYFKFVLQDILYANVIKGNVPSLSWKIAKDLEVIVPIKQDGSLDLEKQNEVVEKYKLIESHLHAIISKLEYLKDLEVEIVL